MSDSPGTENISAGDVPTVSGSDMAENDAAGSEEVPSPSQTTSTGSTALPVNANETAPLPVNAPVLPLEPDGDANHSFPPPPYPGRATTSASSSSSSASGTTVDEVFRRLELEFGRLSQQKRDLRAEREQHLARSMQFRVDENRLRLESDRVERAAQVANAKYEASVQVEADNAAEKARLAKKSKDLDRREKALRSIAISSNTNSGPPRVAHALTHEDNTLPGLHSSSSSLNNRGTTQPDAAEIPDILQHRPSVRRARSENMSPASTTGFSIHDNSGRSVSSSRALSSGTGLYEQVGEGVASGSRGQSEEAEAEAKVELPPGKGIRRVSKSSHLRG